MIANPSSGAAQSAARPRAPASSPSSVTPGNASRICPASIPSGSNPVATSDPSADTLISRRASGVGFFTVMSVHQASPTSGIRLASAASSSTSALRTMLSPFARNLPCIVAASAAIPASMVFGQSGPGIPLARVSSPSRGFSLIACAADMSFSRTAALGAFPETVTAPLSCLITENAYASATGNAPSTCIAQSPIGAASIAAFSRCPASTPGTAPETTARIPSNATCPSLRLDRTVMPARAMPGQSPGGTPAAITSLSETTAPSEMPRARASSASRVAASGTLPVRIMLPARVFSTVNRYGSAVGNTTRLLSRSTSRGVCSTAVRISCRSASEFTGPESRTMRPSVSILIG